MKRKDDEEFKDILLRLLASTGASTYNHATYDDWPAHMGAAIPYELLGIDETEGSLMAWAHLAEIRRFRRRACRGHCLYSHDGGVRQQRQGEAFSQACR